MNLLITVFGGMLLTVLLYGAARLLKLSNFWASVAAAGLPTAAYLAYATGKWPGLDVVTLHVVTYPTISVLLFQLYANKPGKELHVHWVPKLLIAFFVFITVVLGGFVYIAGNGLPPALASKLLPNAQGKTLYTGFAGVVEHGEEAAKSIAQQRNINARLEQLGWNVEVSGLAALDLKHANTVEVLLRRADGAGVVGQQLLLSLHRQGQPVMGEQTMREIGDGVYRGSLTLPAAGVWLASIKFAANGKNIVLEHAVGSE